MYCPPGWKSRLNAFPNLTTIFRSLLKKNWQTHRAKCILGARLGEIVDFRKHDNEEESRFEEPERQTQLLG